MKFGALKKLMGVKVNPIGELLRMYDNKVYVWNGVNLNREMMFRHGFSMKSTVASGDYYDIARKDFPMFVSVAFGCVNLGHGDWCCGDTAAEPAIRMYITNENKVVCCEISDGVTKKERTKLEKIQTAILDNADTVVKNRECELFRTMLCVFHNTLPPAALYSRCITVNDHLDQVYIRRLATELSETWHTYNTRRYHQ